jgi:type II secretory pathway component GspD/PulD (secretin)
MLLERKLLVVEDLPTFIDRIEELLKELDRQPRQMLIEAKILEITLQDAESFGIKWAKFFSTNDGTGALGTKGLNNPLSPGLFIDIITPGLELFLDALRTRDRLRTLSTPKLLALEHQEAEAIIGDRIGYRVTTTINQVTTESIEFLESGVILKVMPSVDGQGRILLDIHPEVSTGTVSDDGIPSQKTTEVTTQMLVEDGQTVFIGGLIKRTMNQSKEGVPLLGDIPIVGGLFANNARNNVSVETVVLITPYLINEHGDAGNEMQIEKTQTIDRELRDRTLNIDSYMDTKEKPLIEQSVTTNTAVDISQQSDIFLLGDW